MLTRQCTYTRNIDARWRNHCCCAKAINIKFPSVSAAFVNQHARRMRRLHCHLWPVWLYHVLPHCLTNGTTFGGENGSKQKKKRCFDFLARLKRLILRRIQQDIIINLRKSPFMVPVIMSDFNKTWIILTDFRKILRYKISWKSVQQEPNCSMRTDGRTDMTKQTFAFCYFANPPNNGRTPYCYKGCLASNTISLAPSAANADCLLRHLDFLIGETYNWFSRSSAREVCLPWTFRNVKRCWKTSDSSSCLWYKMAAHKSLQWRV